MEELFSNTNYIIDRVCVDFKDKKDSTIKAQQLQGSGTLIPTTTNNSLFNSVYRKTETKNFKLLYNGVDNNLFEDYLEIKYIQPITPEYYFGFYSHIIVKYNKLDNKYHHIYECFNTDEYNKTYNIPYYTKTLYIEDDLNNIEYFGSIGKKNSTISIYRIIEKKIDINVISGNELYKEIINIDNLIIKNKIRREEKIVLHCSSDIDNNFIIELTSGNVNYKITKLDEKIKCITFANDYNGMTYKFQLFGMTKNSVVVIDDGKIGKEVLLNLQIQNIDNIQNLIVDSSMENIWVICIDKIHFFKRVAQTKDNELVWKSILKSKKNIYIDYNNKIIEYFGFIPITGNIIFNVYNELQHKNSKKITFIMNNTLTMTLDFVYKGNEKTFKTEKFISITPNNTINETNLTPNNFKNSYINIHKETNTSEKILNNKKQLTKNINCESLFQTNIQVDEGRKQYNKVNNIIYLNSSLNMIYINTYKIQQ